MPLLSVDEAARPDFDGALFPMRKPDGTKIGVLVTHEALADIDSPAPVLDEEYVSRCESHQSTFEEIASKKYDEGATSGPVRIATSDLT